MKDHGITAFLVELFSPRRNGAEEKPTREVPVLSDRQVAFHRGTRETGGFSVKAAARLYQKSTSR